MKVIWILMNSNELFINSNNFLVLVPKGIPDFLEFLDLRILFIFEAK